MHDVPKIVRLRLKRSQSAAPEAHPDADLLTAFAEHSLSGTERTFVMEHLARCGDCRDVVALAMPDAEPVVMPEAARPTRTGWFSLPMLRWGALAAGVLAVASVGVVEYRHRVQEKTLATNTAQRYSVTESVAKNEPASTPNVAPPAIVVQNGVVSKEAVAAPRAHTALSEEKLAPLPGPVAQQPQSQSLAKSAGASAGTSAGIGGGDGGGMGGGKFNVADKGLNGADRKDVASAPGAASPQPAPTAPREAIPEIHQQVIVGQATEMVEVQSGAAKVNTESATVNAQNQIAQNQEDLPLNGRNVTNLSNLDVVKAKDPARAKSASAPPRWAISSAGVLQRSFDGGATWEMVSPSLESVRNGNLKQAESVATTGAVVSRQYGADKAKKVQKTGAPLPNGSLVFRAVSAAGLEVWAGGSGGTLYHSVDGGNSWTHVAPTDSGTILVGDVIGIEFADPQHGRVTTSSAEVWTTADGGQTWRKQ